MAACVPDVARCRTRSSVAQWPRLCWHCYFLTLTARPLPLPLLIIHHHTYSNLHTTRIDASTTRTRAHSHTLHSLTHTSSSSSSCMHTHTHTHTHTHKYIGGRGPLEAREQADSTGVYPDAVEPFVQCQAAQELAGSCGRVGREWEKCTSTCLHNAITMGDVWTCGVWGPKLVFIRRPLLYILHSFFALWFVGFKLFYYFPDSSRQIGASERLAHLTQTVDVDVES